MIQNIQALRCFAALAVVFRHALVWFGFYPPLGLLWVGRSGVDVFFVISGFIMFHTTRRGDRPTGAFWLDRIVRIVPLYWLAMLPVIVLFYLGLPNGESAGLTPDVIARDFLFIPQVRSDGDIHPLLNVGWTLIYEMFFYLLFGLTFFLRSQAKSLAVMTVIFLGGYLLHYVVRLPYVASYYLSPITLEFAGGGLLALLYRRPLNLPQPTARMLGAALVVAGVIGFFGTSWWRGVELGEPTGLRTALYGPMAMLVVAGALVLEKAGLTVRSRLVLFLGAASYSIYLTHTLVQVYAAKLFGATGYEGNIARLVFCLAAIGLACLVGALVHVFIEKPVTAWLKGAAKRRRTLKSVAPEQAT